MKRRILLPLIGYLVAVGLAGAGGQVAAQQGRGGTIVGHVRLMGPSPGNVVIRMGMDPFCAKLTRGTRVIQQAVVTSQDGGLANVFLSVEGSFPQTPVPVEPVVIDQQGCIYRPRVVGARVGQTLQIKSSDQTLHNVHGVSAKENGFNVGQPQAGMVFKFQLKSEEVMLHLTCDVHRWMTGFVGVVSHPYFAVSGDGGAFTIPNVPAGKYTVRAWHERYGPITQIVQVQAGRMTTLDFSYTGNEKPSAGTGIAVQDVVVPDRAMIAQLLAPAFQH